MSLYECTATVGKQRAAEPHRPPGQRPSHCWASLILSWWVFVTERGAGITEGCSLFTDVCRMPHFSFWQNKTINKKHFLPLAFFLLGYHAFWENPCLQGFLHLCSSLHPKPIRYQMHIFSLQPRGQTAVNMLCLHTWLHHSSNPFILSSL